MRGNYFQKKKYTCDEEKLEGPSPPLKLKLFAFMLRNSVPAHQYLGLGDDTGVISEVLHVNLRGGSKASAIDSRTSIHPTVA